MKSIMLFILNFIIAFVMYSFIQIVNVENHENDKIVKKECKKENANYIMNTYLNKNFIDNILTNNIFVRASNVEYISGIILLKDVYFNKYSNENKATTINNINYNNNFIIKKYISDDG